MAIQSDGKIVAAGFSDNGTQDVFGLARYNANGSLDATFNSTGKVTTTFGSGDDDARSIAIQRDGKIVAAGFSMTSTKFVFALARYVGDPPHGITYNGNGSTGGSVPADSNAYAVGATVTVLANTGSLVKIGYTFAGWNTAANGGGTNYAGGATFAMGSGDVTLYAKWTVGRASSTTTLDASPNPSAFGQSVTFTATVTGNAPGGSVSFNDGSSVLCATVPLTSGQASCTIGAIEVNAHYVSAVYAGDSNNAGSTSTVLKQTVTKASMTIAIVNHTPNPSVLGSPISVTVSLAVTAPGAGTPSGTITVSDGSAICVITLPTMGCNLTPGSHDITAAYSGDTNNPAGISGALIQRVIGRAALGVPVWLMLLLD